MHSYIHGTLWLACVLLSGDLCAQDTPSDQSVSLPLSLLTAPPEGDESLPSTNQGNNASRSARSFRDATLPGERTALPNTQHKPSPSLVIEHATLTSVITVSGRHWHQVEFAADDAVNLKLPSDWTNAVILVDDAPSELSILGSRENVRIEPGESIVLTYESRFLRPPEFQTDVTVRRSTREIFGPESVGLSLEDSESLGGPVQPAEAILQFNRESEWTHRLNHDLKTEFSFGAEQELVQSAHVLGQVVDKFHLATCWRVSRAEAIAELRAGLTLRNPRNLDLIFLRSTHGFEVANAVTQFYLTHRDEVGRDRVDRAMKELQSQLKAQTDKVEALRLRMLDLAENLHGVPLAYLEGPRAESVLSRVAYLTTMLEKLEGLEGTVLMQALTEYDFHDPTFHVLWPLYQREQLKESNWIRVGLGSKHPKRVATQGQLRKLEALLLDAAQSIVLKHRHELTRKKEALRLARELEAIRPSLSKEDRRRLALYREACREHTIEKGILSDMQSTYATDLHPASLAHTPITVHEEALPSPGNTFHKLSQVEDGAWAAVRL